ncbi:MAG: DUF1351 domain-containing protein [Dyella sp.]|uniref:DUF1351 domain-containing protein n=1 Tax=Dyella sp. TaxID=1869338 RepID=UPI003F7D6C27
MSKTEDIKDAGSNLTAIAEYTETAAALADLRQRHAGVVYDVTQPKEMKKAKEARAELRGLRVALEKKRQELKAPVLERGRLLDSEAKRITEELVALEEPIDVQIKAEEARVEEERLRKLEEERLRVEAIQNRIAEIRNLPSTLIGKPSVILQGKLERLRNEPPVEEEFAEHFLTAQDAHTACIARVQQMLDDQLAHEAEQKRIAADREELERTRAENERLQREADERRLADQRRERERVDAIRARIDGIACMARNLDGLTVAELEETRRALQTMSPETSGADFAEFRDQAMEAWDSAEAALSQTIERRQQQEEEARQRAAEEQARREEEDRRRQEEEARLQAERDRQAAEQKRLEEEAEKLRQEREAAAAKAERERLASLGLREAAQAASLWFMDNGHENEQVAIDLRAALHNDDKLVCAAEAKPARSKRAAA